MSNQAQKIAVVGAGAMGSVLARTWLDAGYPVIVWNRTPERVAALVERGAQQAPSLHEAVAAADVVVTAVIGYDVLNTQLATEGREDVVAGKTIVQYTTATAPEVRRGHEWAQAQGATLIDGTIENFPTQIGTPDATISYAGPRKAFDALEPVFAALGGTPQLVSEQIAAATVKSTAMVPFWYAAMLGYLHGAAVTENEDFSIDEHTEAVIGWLPFIESSIRDAAAMIKSGNYGEGELDCPVTAQAHAVTSFADGGEASGVQAPWLRHIVDLLDSAAKGGYADKEFAAIYQVIKESGDARR